ncbi:hypothetical protein QIW49_02590 [Francisellaceae bacterium CB300]
MIVSKEKIKIIILSVAIYFLLIFTYVYDVNSFLYSGFVFDSSVLYILPRLVVSLLLLLFCVLMLFSRQSQLITIVFYLIYLFYFLPLLAYFSVSDMIWYAFLCCSLSYIALIYSIKFGSNYIIKSCGGSYHIEVFIIIFLLIIELLVIIHAFSVSHDYVISFANVYLYRSTYGEIINSGLWGYLNAMVISLISPYIGVYCLFNRKYKMYAFFIIMDILLFSSTGHKVSLFYFFLEFGLFFIINKNKAISSLSQLYRLSICFFSILLFLVFLGSLSTSLRSWIFGLLYRAFFTPAKLYNDYFTFILSGYGKLTYQTTGASYNGMSIAGAVGIYNSSFAQANTGYVASAYILGGFAWVCLYTCIFCILLIIANIIMKSLESKSNYMFLLFALPTMTAFISTSLSTTFLTGGFFLSFIIALLVLLGYKNE